MSTWILRADGPPPPTATDRVAVKDLVDVAGLPTTSGSAAVAATAVPAAADAACLAPVRASGAWLAGKANLHELAFGGTGINPWFGTPTNPLDPTRVPGGSSSGCAVAVAVGEADWAVGTDSAGSIRTPSACCGTVGLKTTWGRIPLDGIRPLAPTLDTVGPMGRDVAATARGLRALRPDLDLAVEAAPVVGRVRLEGTDPVVDAAIDALLAAAGLAVVEVALPGWSHADQAARTVLFGEAWQVNRALVAADPAHVGADLHERFEVGAAIHPDDLDDARHRRPWWRGELAQAFRRAPVLVLPTLRTLAPTLDDPAPDTRYANAPVNLAGHPSLALPAPTGGHLPASCQLVGPDDGEPLLLATGAVLEAAAATLG
ncbi:MAG: amidase [Acidimicrobiia bacterium]